MSYRPKRGPATAAFQALQRRWDKKLKAGGFVDIECGTDLNEADGWTFRGGDRKHGGRVKQISSVDEDGDEQVGSLAATAQFRFWTMATHVANALPPDYPNREFILEVTETGNVWGAARKRGRHREWGQAIFKTFIKKHGLKVQ